MACAWTIFCARVSGVDAYYSLQAYRIRSGNQAQALAAQEEPNRLTTYFGECYWRLECQIQRVLDAYSAAQPVSRWARANRGIGPVLAAGLLAHLDADPPATVGAWWRFQGYDPTIQWLGSEKARALVVEVAPRGLVPAGRVPRPSQRGRADGAGPEDQSQSFASRKARHGHRATRSLLGRAVPPDAQRDDRRTRETPVECASEDLAMETWGVHGQVQRP